MTLNYSHSTPSSGTSKPEKVGETLSSYVLVLVLI